MKLATLTAIILLSAGSAIAKPAFTATSKTSQIPATVTSVSRISKIEVHGNVKLYVSNCLNDQVKVYGSSIASTFSPDQNGVLNITSNKTEQLEIWVTASQLNDLEVYNNAEVVSFGNLSAIELDVNLYNNASAQLNLDVYQANVTVNGDSKINLSGKTDNIALKYDQLYSVDTTNLLSNKMVTTGTFEQIAINL